MNVAVVASIIAYEFVRQIGMMKTKGADLCVEIKTKMETGNIPNIKTRVVEKIE